MFRDEFNNHIHMLEKPSDQDKDQDIQTEEFQASQATVSKTSSNIPETAIPSSSASSTTRPKSRMSLLFGEIDDKNAELVSPLSSDQIHPFIAPEDLSPSSFIDSQYDTNTLHRNKSKNHISHEKSKELSNKNRISAGLELCMAAYEDDLNYLRLLLKFGCPVNASDYDRRTAAHICCAENLLSSVLLLSEYNADFVSDNVKDR